jgi:four helix bundle protein
MFDFEKLDVYQVVKEQNNKVIIFLNNNTTIDNFLKEEWKIASLGSVLNLAEGTGRKNPEEKKDFLVEARGNVFSGAAILQIVNDMGLIDEMTYQDFYDGYEKASKMLLGMFRSYSNRREGVPQTEVYNEQPNY